VDGFVIKSVNDCERVPPRINNGSRTQGDFGGDSRGGKGWSVSHYESRWKRFLLNHRSDWPWKITENTIMFAGLKVVRGTDDGISVRKAKTLPC